MIYTGEQNNWMWDTDANRINFKSLRIRSDAAKNNSKFVIAAVVVNHIISAFSAGRKAVAHNRSLSYLENIQIKAFTINSGLGVDGLGLNIETKF